MTLNVLAPVIEHAGITGLVQFGDAKATLATLLEEEAGDPPVYTTTRTSGGNDANTVYMVEVYSGERLLGDGAGFTPAMAEAEAAKEALLREFTAEVDEVVLPSSWGDFAAEDAEAMIGKLFPAPSDSKSTDE